MYAGCDNDALCRWAYNYRGGLGLWTIFGATSTTAPVAVATQTGDARVTARDRNDRLILWQSRVDHWTPTDLGPAQAAAGTAIAQAPMPGGSSILYARSTTGTLTARTINP